MKIDIQSVLVLLLISSMVAIFARRIRIPYTVGLVLTGIVVALLQVHVHVELSKELIFTALLPPLLYEAAIQTPWLPLKRDLPVIIVFATVGVVVSTVITALGLVAFGRWSIPIALLLGVLISATDPVSVIATFREAGVGGRLRLLVEAESLMNDGTVAVLFTIALTVVTGQSVSAQDGIVSFFLSSCGGIVCGALVAGAALLLSGTTEDHLVEILFSVLAAYGSFLAAESLHLSGVLATTTAGIILGNWGSLGSISDRGRETVETFWEVVGFMANSLIFLLIGLRLGAGGGFVSHGASAVIVIIFVTLGRAVAVYGCSFVFRRSSMCVSRSHQHILFWGGLRGALALALSLSIPETVIQKPQIVAVTFLVVTFSVIVQGVTISPLLRRLGELPNIKDGHTNA